MRSPRLSLVVSFPLLAVVGLPNPTYAQDFALEFDGASAATLTSLAPIAFDGSSDFTVELWLQVAAGRSVYHILGKRLSCTHSNLSIQLARDPSGLLHFGSNTNVASFGVDAPPNQWTHVAIVYEAGEVRLLLDGVRRVTIPSFIMNVGNTVPLLLGDSGGCSPVHRFVGQIDDLRVWNVARTDSEISANRDRVVAPQHPDLLAYFDFNEPQSSQDIVDRVSGTTGGFLGYSSNVESGDARRVGRTSPIPQPTLDVEVVAHNFPAAMVLGEAHQPIITLANHGSLAATVNARVSTMGYLRTRDVVLPAGAVAVVPFPAWAPDRSGRPLVRLEARLDGDLYQDNNQLRFRTTVTAGTTPWITTVEPASLAPRTDVTITLRGGNFTNGSVLTLEDSIGREIGRSIITQRSRNGDWMRFRLLLTSTPRFVDMYLTTTAGDRLLVLNDYDIVERPRSAPSVDISAPVIVRPGQAGPVEITVSNPNNFDIEDVVIIISGSDQGDIVVVEPALPIDQLASSPVGCSAIEATLRPITLPVIPAEGSISLSLLSTPNALQSSDDITAFIVDTPESQTIQSEIWDTLAVAPFVVSADQTLFPGSTAATRSNRLSTAFESWRATSLRPASLYDGWLPSYMLLANGAPQHVAQSTLDESCAQSLLLPRIPSATANVLSGRLPLNPRPILSATSLSRDVVTSIDPNEIVGPTGAGPERFLRSPGTLNYILFFENQDSATAPAQRIVLRVPVDPQRFDLESLRFHGLFMGGQTIAFEGRSDEGPTILGAVGTPGISLEASADLDYGTGSLEIVLQAIDAATGLPPQNPLAGLLVPNQTSPEGEGYVRFSLAPLGSSSDGDVLQINGAIVFDANPEIVTNTWSNTLDYGEPTASITTTGIPPIVTSNELLITWSAIDSGSGVRYVDLIRTTGDSTEFIGRFQPTVTSTVITLVSGEDYAIHAIATDAVGNTETDAGPEVEFYVDADSDGDGVPDSVDFCVGNDLTLDTDGDGTCDDVDLDIDGDGVPNATDSQPTVAPSLILSPGDASFILGQLVTMSFHVTALEPSVSITGLDGSRTTGGETTTCGSDLLNCIGGFGHLVSGATSFHCTFFVDYLGAGTHAKTVTLQLSNGQSVSDTVTWDVSP